MGSGSTEPVLYLIPETTYAARLRLASRVDLAFPDTKLSLARALDTEGLLARKSRSQRTYNAWVEGGNEPCWCIRVVTIYPFVAEEPSGTPDGPDGPGAEDAP